MSEDAAAAAAGGSGEGRTALPAGMDVACHGADHPPPAPPPGFTLVRNSVGIPTNINTGTVVAPAVGAAACSSSGRSNGGGSGGGSSAGVRVVGSGRWLAVKHEHGPRTVAECDVDDTDADGEGGGGGGDEEGHRHKLSMAQVVGLKGLLVRASRDTEHKHKHNVESPNHSLTMCTAMPCATCVLSIAFVTMTTRSESGVRSNTKMRSTSTKDDAHTADRW
jgi:hypothetical protein